MSLQTFTPDELEVKETIPGMRGAVEIYNTPITPKENMTRLLTGKTPMWIPSANEMANIRIDVDPENIARSPKGGIDGYGVEWIFVDVAGGAMVKPGAPKVPDICEWEKYITVPDPETWDWQGCYDRNKDKIRPGMLTHIGFGICLFERLIAVCDFGEAAMALIDPDAKEAVHRFFRAVTDYRKKYYTLCKKWFNCDSLNFNDDWGSQRAPFFSNDTAKEMLVPYVKESVQCIHDLGCFADLHCCGMVEPLVPFFIEEGFDSWGGQPLNDKPKLKKMYDGQGMVFTHEITLAPDASDEDVDNAVAKFMEDFGYDNRGLFGSRDQSGRVRRKLYEASRKNYDRLLAEGKVIL